jgi:hypothetical protein
MIGIIETVCVILYIIPQTAVLGAILETALLGGAIATNVRVDNPLFSHELFGVYLGVLVWLRPVAARSAYPDADAATSLAFRRRT